MYIITIVDASDKPTGAVYALTEGLLWPLGTPLTDHSGWTFLRWRQEHLEGYIRAADERLKVLKERFS